MRKIDLAGRFERALNLVRLEVQANLTRFFEEDRLAMLLYLDAAGIRFDDSLITDYDRRFWMQHGGQLFFLPAVSDSMLDGMFESPTTPRSGPAVYLSRGKDVDWHGHLAAAASSLFGTWVFFHDRARGSYYFPFPSKNYQFCSVGRDREVRPVLPAMKYLRAVEPLLRGFSLELGEGSLGLARRLDRDVIVEDTFTDPRGSVALEDLLLRNFSFCGFAISSTAPQVTDEDSTANSADDVIAQSRFGDDPFSVLGLIFPAPIRGEEAANACLRLFEHVKTRSMKRLSDILEPLACHVDDTVLREALRRVASEMAERPAEGRVDQDVAAEELRRRFAAAIAGRGDPFDEMRTDDIAASSSRQEVGGISNLRDPFAIGAVHILETDDKRENLAVRGYWHGENSFARSVREKLESTRMQTGLGAAAFVKDVCSELNSSLAKVVRRDAFELQPVLSSWEIGEFGTALLCGIWHQDAQSNGGVPDESTEARASDETILARRSRTVQTANPDELLAEADRWAHGSYQSNAKKGDVDLRSKGTGAAPEKFGEAVRRHKTVEAMLNLSSSFIGRTPTEEGHTFSISYVDLLGLISGLPGESGAWSSLWLGANDKAAGSPADDKNGPPMLFFSAYRPRLGLEQQIGCYLDGERFELSQKVTEELFRPHTYRTLLLAALYAGHLIEQDSSSEWCSVRISGMESSSEDSPLRSGVFSESGTWKIYGFGTALSDRAFWEQVLKHPIRRAAEWLLRREDGDATNSGAVEIILASDEARAETIRGVFPPRKGLALCLRWTKEARRWNFCNWTLAPELLPRGTPVGVRNIPLEQGSSLLRVLGSCREANDSRALLQKSSFTYCYPRLSPDAGDAPLRLAPSALRKKTVECPCVEVSADVREKRPYRNAEDLVAFAAAEFRAAVPSNDLVSTLGAGALSTIWPLSYYGGESLIPGAVVLTMSRAEPAVSRRWRRITRIATTESVLGSRDSAVGARSSTAQAVSPLASALVSQAIDYLRFVLAQDAAHRRLTSELSGFAHSLQHAFGFQTNLLQLFKNAQSIVDSANRRWSTEASDRWLKKAAGHYAPFSPEERAQARKFERAAFELRSPDIDANTTRLSVPIITGLAERYQAFDTSYYLGHLLIRALTRTLAGKPEERSDLRSRDEKEPLRPRFADAAAWISHLFERRWNDLGTKLREAIEKGWMFSMPNGCTHPRLVNCIVFPGSSLEIVVDELVKNLRNHADMSRDVAFKLCDDGLRDQLVLESTSYPKTDDKPGTSKGILLIRRIVEANTGMQGSEVVAAGMDGDLWRTVVRIDLKRYEERELADRQKTKLEQEVMP